MLQEQANAPFDIQSYKGVQAPIPWTAVLAKALQGGLAGYQGRKADEQKAAIGEQTRKGLADYLQQSSANYKIPNIQASPLMKEEQVRQPMAQPVGLQSMAPPAGITNGMVESKEHKLAAALAAQGGVQGAAPTAPNPNLVNMTQDLINKQVPVTPPAAAGAMVPPASAPFRPQTIPVPDMTPQPAMINRPAVDRQQMVLQGIASDNPLIRQVAPSMYDQATKDVAKENMASAIKAIDIGDADPAVIKLYMESENPSGAIDYLSKFGMAKTEAKAKMDELVFRLSETANQNEQNRLSREGIAAEASADRRAMAGQASADRRAIAAQSIAERQIAREDRLSQLTPLQQNELMSIVKSTNAVKTALNAVDTPGAFSAARGAATRMGPLGESLAARNDTPDQRNARAQVFNVMSSIIKERAGTAQSKSELATLNSFLPNAYDTGPIIKDKLKGFERYLADQEKAVMTVSRYGVQQPAASGAADPLGLR